MANNRAFHVNGPTMVRVKGNGLLGVATTQGQTAGVFELGLATEKITINPRFIHVDVQCDDYGREIPPEVLWSLADVTIDMTLVHYDQDVLRACIGESMGGRNDGIYAGALMPMGNGLPLYANGNHYMALGLLGFGPQGEPPPALPWRFPSAYLSDRPFEMNVGTEKCMVRLRWRAIAYAAPPTAQVTRQIPSFVPGNLPITYTATVAAELTSANKILWDHGILTGPPAD